MLGALALTEGDRTASPPARAFSTSAAHQCARHLSIVDLSALVAL